VRSLNWVLFAQLRWTHKVDRERQQEFFFPRFSFDIFLCQNLRHLFNIIIVNILVVIDKTRIITSCIFNKCGKGFRNAKNT
jgi:hypothetical protein